MSITIPNRKALRLCTDIANNNAQTIPAVAAVALTNPGPVCPDAAQTADCGLTQVIQAKGASGRLGYLGYNFRNNVAAGAATSILRGVTIEGFAGMTPGDPLYIDDDGADKGEATAGLTHEAPVAGLAVPIGVALTATKARFH